MEKKKFKGLIAATVTPMLRNGEVNYGMIDTYAEFLIRQGVNGVFVCGTTGESLFLDATERMKIAECWVKYADKLDVFVHVGCVSYKDAQKLAEHAQKSGASAISAMGPCFLQPKGVLELVEYNEMIAEKAPDIPYYYYHIPGTSGVNINMLDFLRIADKYIPNLNGIKYTSYNTMEMQECISFDNNKFDILHGHDETLLNGLILGATGGIGTSYNITASYYNKLLAAFYAGKVTEAVKMQNDILPFIRLMIKHENAIVGIKAMLNIIGIDCGPCRLPLRNLTLEEMQNLEMEMKNVMW